MNSHMFFYSICAAAVFIMIIYFMKRKRKFLSFLFGAVTGISALLLINKYGYIIGADIPLNLFNFCGSAILGVPFVVCIVILKYL